MTNIKPSAQGSSVPVLIAGAGPTGLMLAIELARRGIACRIIDKSASQAAHSQALGVQARTLEIFQSIGIEREFLTGGWKIKGGKVYASGRQIVHVRFDSLDQCRESARPMPSWTIMRYLSRIFVKQVSGHAVVANSS